MAGAGQATLLTFAPMVDSEFARLLLRHYRVPFREADHMFGWCSLVAIRHGGYGRIPLLHGNGPRLTGPRNIFAHFDPLALEGQRLMPEEGASRAAVERDLLRYNGDLALDVAVASYFHLLSERALMIALFAKGIPRWEARGTPVGYPVLRLLFKLLLRLNPQRAADSIERIHTIFDETDERLRDGRRFLAGDNLTLGDIALASASASLLHPPGYAAPVPTVEQMPPVLRDLAHALAARPTARLVERIYAAIPEQSAQP
jgi:glutathione S-transferase